MRRNKFHDCFEVLIIMILVRKILRPYGLVLTLLFSILFSITIFPVPSNAEWTKVFKNDAGNTFFIDFERILNKDGFIYFWSLIDRQSENHLGYLSTQVYRQTDCKMSSFKILKYSFHEKQMGNESGTSLETKNPNWAFPSPSSVEELLVKTICKY